jgi:outer membrane lipase/esterase
MRRLTLRSLETMALLAVLALASALHAAPLSGAYFFGDSLTDRGNAALLNTPPGADSFSNPPARSPVPYPLVGSDGFVYTPVYVPPWQRPYETSERFTNGFTWASAFASSLGFPGAAAPSLAGGNNYAVGGASVVPLTSPPTLPPSALEQLALFRATHGGTTGTFDPNALYFIGAGGNDLRAILVGQVTPQAGAAGIVGGLTSMAMDLLSWGAQRIVLWNAPDVTVTPQFLAAVQAGLITPQQAADFLKLINDINGAIAQLDLLAGVDVFDFAGLIRDAVAQPGKYGLANATLPCGFIDVYSATGGACTDAFLFWDGIHPTSAGHRVIANAMIAFVPEPSSLALLLAATLGLAMLRSWRPATR